ncbi:SRPBCC family protein [Actinokineospora soli]|uniref:SRPBCC family protein n=1 Tax=Actinokineospora soli TaxID=1048753 RepID=A0ABW2TJG2_9PSEU
MIELVRSADVPAPPDRVWAVVADPRRAPDWFSFAERTEVLSGSGVGELRRQHGRWGARRSEIDQEVIAYAPGELIAWKHVAERLDGKPAPVFSSSSVFRIELAPVDGGTRVTLRVQQEPASFLRGLAMRLMGARHITERLEESLVRLPGAVD